MQLRAPLLPSPSSGLSFCRSPRASSFPSLLFSPPPSSCSPSRKQLKSLSSCLDHRRRGRERSGAPVGATPRVCARLGARATDPGGGLHHHRRDHEVFPLPPPLPFPSLLLAPFPPLSAAISGSNAPIFGGADAMVGSINRGGALVNFEGLRGFLPGSHAPQGESAQRGRGMMRERGTMSVCGLKGKE